MLAPEGLLMFSTLGPDTLKELRAAAGAARVHAFVDMHDLGDMLVASGFSAPVMDMEMIEIDYAHGQACSPTCARAARPARVADRPRGLAGKGFGERLRACRRARRSRWSTATPGAAGKRAASVEPGAENRAYFQAHALRRASWM